MYPITLSKKQVEELHSLAFYVRQTSKLDDSKEGEKMEILAIKWDDIFHELIKK